MQVAPCNSYHAKIESNKLLSMPDGKSLFKLYYVSIVGRATPERFEWAHTPLAQADYEKAFLASGHEGIGFLTAFPHITKLFRYSPQAEILMLVKAFNSQTGEDINLDRGENYVEFACLAEAVIAAAEYRFWGEANSVEDYLQQWCPLEETPLRNAAKLKSYWER
jgi:hypothetical protein